MCLDLKLKVKLFIGKCRVIMDILARSFSLWNQYLASLTDRLTEVKKCLIKD